MRVPSVSHEYMLRKTSITKRLVVFYMSQHEDRRDGPESACELFGVAKRILDIKSLLAFLSKPWGILKPLYCSSFELYAIQNKSVHAIRL